ncbi:MAG: hypothetical protein ACRCXY_07690 [Fusobacteriaceae bacterium]
MEKYTYIEKLMTNDLAILSTKSIYATYFEKTRVEDRVDSYSSIKKFYFDMKENIPYYESECSDEFDYIAKMAELSLKNSEFNFYQLNSFFNIDLCNMQQIKTWEKELGILSDLSINLSQRKNIVKAKYFSVFNDFTKKNLEKISKLMGSISFSLLVNIPGEKITFWVYLDDTMTNHLRTLMSIVKPAHLIVDVENSKKWSYAHLLGTWKDVKKNGDWINLEI